MEIVSNKKERKGRNSEGRNEGDSRYNEGYENTDTPTFTCTHNRNASETEAEDIKERQRKVGKETETVKETKC